MSAETEGLAELVRERYAAAATMAAAGAPPSCCDSTGRAVDVGEGFGADLLWRGGARRANGLTATGFIGITITPTHPVAEGMHSAIIRATKAAAAQVSWSWQPATDSLTGRSCPSEDS